MPFIDGRTIPEILMRPGIHGRFLAHKDLGASTVSLLMNRADPGAAVPLHMHHVEETVVMFEGRIWVQLGDERRVIGPNDTNKTESGVAVREVGEVGRCTFNRETQVEHCEKRLIKPDGSIMLGTTESKYSFGNDKTLKMTVTPKMITDTPFTNAPFDAFPVHCPDDVVWSILNEVGRSR